VIEVHSVDFSVFQRLPHVLERGFFLGLMRSAGCEERLGSEQR